MKINSEIHTDEWQLYENGVDYKNRIGLYKTVNENYRYFEGDQWGNTKSETLPLPVFNFMKPILNYKIAQLFDNPAKIIYQCTNRTSEDFEYLKEVAGKLTDYAENLWEHLKMEKNMEDLVTDGAITGNGIVYFYYDEKTNEIDYQQVDITNIYPANPNSGDIQEQPYIIIAFRHSTADVKAEAAAWRDEKQNKLEDYEIEGISSDDDTNYLAGDSAKIEIDSFAKTTVLLKMWKEGGTVHFKKSTRSCVIAEDVNTGLERYPVAKFDWDKRKNSFFGVSEVSEIKPNQDYVNTMGAMIMASSTFTAFPKMVYNADYVDNPSNDVGIAIAVDGNIDDVKNAIGYINPGNISSDAFSMFQQTMEITKDLKGANDAALGNVNPDQASGKAIIAVMEQSQVPLDRIRRRYYDFIEDIALIWADMWNYYTDSAKEIIARDENDTEKVYYVDKMAFEKLMLEIKIDVGASNRFSVKEQLRTLENLLTAGYITFDMFLQLIPDGTYLPVKKLQELIEKEKQKKAEEQITQQTGGGEYSAEDVDGAADMLAEQNAPDVDEMVNSMSEEEAQMYKDNPQALRQMIEQNMKIPNA